MKDFKNDTQYAHSRLSNSFVKLNGKIIRVHFVSETGVVSYFKNNEHSKPFKCKLTDLDLSPIKLGNIVYNGSVRYIDLAPIRQYKQGLRPQSLINVPMGFNMYFLQQPENNDYLSIDYCLDLLENEEVNALPWHRKFSLKRSKKGKNTALIYKSKAVGVVNEDNGKMDLDSKFNFLSESLEEAIHAA